MGAFSKEIIDIKTAANILGVSTATIRNWVKCKELKVVTTNKKLSFFNDDIIAIKKDIEKGKTKKLYSRANKSKAERTFFPKEYQNTEISSSLKIIAYIKEHKIDISISLFLLSLNILANKKIISKISIPEILTQKEIRSTNQQIIKEIHNWLSEISTEKIKSEYSFLLTTELATRDDILGFIYQSLLTEGSKSSSGSYYTPKNIVSDVTNEYVRSNSRALDPCCGTGQFLLSFADKIDNPNNIYGLDIDKIAVKISRLNLLIKYKDIDFEPNIFCTNTILDTNHIKSIGKFDIIATNPPWGAHFSEKETKQLQKLYPQIKSLESFSYFIKQSIDLLDKKGIISYILPESILNVKMHKDIREILTSNTQIDKVLYLNRIFKNVFTPVIRLDFSNKKNETKNCEIIKTNSTYFISPARWEQNQDFIFNIHANNTDNAIIDNVYNTNHKTLKNNADWALGIVTGNNNKNIVSKKKKNFQAIYKGKEVKKFVLKEATNYILFTPEIFQQVARIEKYKAKEKLIYKFISKNLVFAYDNTQKLTLNSANILIPKLQDYPIKAIAALFNSSLYNFIFQKKFSSIKVLKNHIEQLPLPLWDNKVLEHITKLADNYISGKIEFNEIDNYIFKQFNFSEDEIKHVMKDRSREK